MKTKPFKTFLCFHVKTNYCKVRLINNYCKYNDSNESTNLFCNISDNISNEEEP